MTAPWTNGRRPSMEVLSPRERHVAMVVGRGATSKQAARELGISVKTIEFHLGNVFRKLGMATRAELANLVGREEAGPRRPAVAGNLPAARTSLVGREAAVQAVQSFLESRWLTSIVGPGGVGKTRLALEVARAASDRFADGAWLVELAGVADGRDVIAVTAGDLRLDVREGWSAEAVASALAAQHRLVVVDNCEHVVDAAAEMIDAIGRRCPHVTVLATSRERLELDGEQVLPLGPLSLDPGGQHQSSAAELFCARAQLARGSFELDPGERHVVERICRSLDGLPLAIELAASRLGSHDLADVAAQLATPLDVLRRARGAPARQLSLHATIEWSYGRLEPAEREMFDQLSAFAGSFAADAALEVGTPTASLDDGEERLRSLVRRSMVVRDDDRFQLLDTLRSFGAARLDASGRTAATRRRLLTHFVARAEAYDALVRSPAERIGHRAFERDWHNIRHAMRIALELGDLDAAGRLVVATAWWAHTRAQLEVGEWAWAVLDAADPHDTRRPALLMAACAIQFLRGELVGLIELVAEARNELHRLALPAEPWIPYVESHYTTLQEDTKRAAYRELREWSGEHGDPFWTAIADGMVADGLAVAIRAGSLAPDDASRAVEKIRRVRSASEQGGASGRTARALYAEGVALQDLDPDAATDALEAAQELADELGLTDTSAAAAGALAGHHTRQHRPRLAAVVLARTMESARRRGAFGTLQVASLRAPTTLIALGRPSAAAAVLATLHAARSNDEAIDQAMDETYGLPELEAQLVEVLGEPALRQLITTASPLGVNEMTLFVLAELEAAITNEDLGVR